MTKQRPHIRRLRSGKKIRAGRGSHKKLRKKTTIRNYGAFDYEDWERKQEEEEKKREFGLDPYDTEGNSTIVKQEGDVALIRHHDSYAPASEMATTYEIRQKGGKSLWRTHDFSLADQDRFGVESSERKSAMHQFRELTKDARQVRGEKAFKEFFKKNYGVWPWKKKEESIEDIDLSDIDTSYKDYRPDPRRKDNLSPSEIRLQQKRLRYRLGKK